MQTYIDNVTEMVKSATNIKNIHLAKMYALLVLVKGTNITLEDVHNAWAMDMNFRPKNEYCYGHEHRSIVPFDQLPEETKDKDKKYLTALRKVATDMFNNVRGE